MNIKIYSKTNCPYCVRAKAWFASKNLPYEEVSLDDPIARLQFLESVGPTVKTVPQVYVDDVRIGGYDDLMKSDLVKQFGL